ncbi:MAG: hypothetical protein AB1714_12915 [Acidobacteriota bacterium]
MRRLRVMVALGFGWTTAVWAADPGTDSPDRSFVLDTEAKAVIALDAITGKTSGSVQLGGQPDTMFWAAHGERLVVIDPGPGEMTARSGFRPRGRSSIAVIDPTEMKLAGRTEIGWNLEEAFLDPGGDRLVAFCSGYRSQKPGEALPREIYVVDIVQGRVAARANMPRPVASLVLSKDGRTIMAFSPAEEPQEGSFTPAELRFLSVETGELLLELPLNGDPGPPALSHNGHWLYILDPGRRDKKDKIDGNLQVVSTSDGTIQSLIDVGSEPSGLFFDDSSDRVFLLSNGAAGKDEQRGQGELRVIEGALPAATIRVGPSPSFVRISPDRSRLYVLAPGLLTAIKMPALELEWQMALESAEAIVAKGGLITPPKHPYPVDEFAIAPDGRCGFVLYEESNKLQVVDLEKPAPVATVETGRAAVRFAKYLGAVAATAASAAASAYGWSPGDVYTVAPADTSMAIRPDGKYVYVLNTQTEDVTVVDSATARVVAKIGGGGDRLQLLGGGDVLAIPGYSSLHLIDTRAQKALPEIPIDGVLWSLLPSEDGRHVLAVGEKEVICLDSSTGRIVAKARGFRQAGPALFDYPRRPAPELVAQTQPSPQSQPFPRTQPDEQ